MVLVLHDKRVIGYARREDAIKSAENKFGSCVIDVDTEIQFIIEEEDKFERSIRKEALIKLLQKAIIDQPEGGTTLS